jgi:hypothetical protein
MRVVRTDDDGFARSRARFEEMVGFLDGAGAAELDHGELEERLQTKGRELLRLLYQDHLDLRAARERRLDEVVDAFGVDRPAAEAGHARALATVFGEVSVTRLAYRRRGHANLHPADAGLNLPRERHSHGLRRLAAAEASRGSFDEATGALRGATGAELGKRQVEQLAGRAVVDFEAFYGGATRAPADPSDVLVLSADGKGIVMRPPALRPATAEAAARTNPKLKTRLSKGEKRNRKRMAEVGAVYDVTPVPRRPADVLAAREDEPAPSPKAKAKWLTASVVDDAAEVITKVFDEAERRDPAHARTWVALVDGNNHQIDRIRAEATQRGITLPILIDFIHVLEYLWRAAWSFHPEGDPDAETWVNDKALAILNGQASTVAAAIRRKATRHGLTPSERANADRCADYLLNKRDNLDYPTALRKGWPIATGVIEGACRHLVKDRMDITGARWGLTGAEAILKLRALRANGDFDDYWRYHIAQERQRVHESRYANGHIPQAA